MIVDCAVHENGVRREGKLALEDAYEAGREPNAFVWIGLSSHGDPQVHSCSFETV